MYELADGPKRFKELRDTNQNISAKVLTESIQDLMNEGLIVRISYPEVPPRVNYFLSKNGKSLIPLIREMLVWGTEHQNTAVNGQPMENQKTNNAGKKRAINNIYKHITAVYSEKSKRLFSYPYIAVCFAAGG